MIVKPKPISPCPKPHKAVEELLKNYNHRPIQRLLELGEPRVLRYIVNRVFNRNRVLSVDVVYVCNGTDIAITVITDSLKHYILFINSAQLFLTLTSSDLVSAKHVMNCLNSIKRGRYPVILDSPKVTYNYVVNFGLEVSSTGTVQAIIPNKFLYTDNYMVFNTYVKRRRWSKKYELVSSKVKVSTGSSINIYTGLSVPSKVFKVKLKVAFWSNSSNMFYKGVDESIKQTLIDTARYVFEC